MFHRAQVWIMNRDVKLAHKRADIARSRADAVECTFRPRITQYPAPTLSLSPSLQSSCDASSTGSKGSCDSASVIKSPSVERFLARQVRHPPTHTQHSTRTLAHSHIRTHAHTRTHSHYDTPY